MEPLRQAGENRVQSSGNRPSANPEATKKTKCCCTASRRRTRHSGCTGCCCTERNVYLYHRGTSSSTNQESGKASLPRKDPQGSWRQRARGASSNLPCPTLNCDDSSPCRLEEQPSAASQSQSAVSVFTSSHDTATMHRREHHENRLPLGLHSPPTVRQEQNPTAPTDCLDASKAVSQQTRCCGSNNVAVCRSDICTVWRSTANRCFSEEHSSAISKENINSSSLGTEPLQQTKKGQPLSAYGDLTPASGETAKKLSRPSCPQCGIQPSAQCRISSNISGSYCGLAPPCALGSAHSGASSGTPGFPAGPHLSNTSGRFGWGILPADILLKACGALPTSWVHTLRGSSTNVPTWWNHGTAHQIDRIPVIRAGELRNACAPKQAPTIQLSSHQQEQQGHQHHQQESELAWPSSRMATVHRPAVVNSAIQTENTHMLPSAEDPLHTCDRFHSSFAPAPVFAPIPPPNAQGGDSKTKAACRCHLPSHGSAPVYRPSPEHGRSYRSGSQAIAGSTLSVADAATAAACNVLDDVGVQSNRQRRNACKGRCSEAQREQKRNRYPAGSQKQIPNTQQSHLGPRSLRLPLGVTKSTSPKHKRVASNNSLGIQTEVDHGNSANRPHGNMQREGLTTAAIHAAAELQAAAAAFGMAIGRLSSLACPAVTNRQTATPENSGPPLIPSDANNKPHLLAVPQRPFAPNGRETSWVTSERDPVQREKQLLDCMAASFAAVKLQP